MNRHDVPDRSARPGRRRVVDLSGLTFGSLRVVRRDDQARGRAAWWCRCACGNPDEVSAGERVLLHGARRYCGPACPCKSRDLAASYGDGPQKAFRLTTRIFNHRLVLAREQLGHPSALSAATALGLPYAYLVALESLRAKPWHVGGEWTADAVRIAVAYGLSPEYLWPGEIHSVRKTSASMTLDAPDGHDPGARAFANEVRPALASATASLTPMEARIVAMRHGLQLDDDLRIDAFEAEEPLTWREIGERHGLSRTRIEQIYQRAIGKMRKTIEAKHEITEDDLS